MTRHRDVMDSPLGDEGQDDIDAMEASDPMSGLANLADCMLVLACGLMITLVVHWNLDVTPRMETVEETGDMVEVESDPELAVASDDAQSGGEGQGKTYENMGTLYRDNDTGKLYYLREFDE